MAMELEIISPKPGQKFPPIRWNNEELKAEITAAMADYQNIVVTPETEKDSKALRTKLNKLRTAIETARKDMKSRVMEPLKVFEAQVKEVEEPIDKAIGNLDGQLSEIKTMKQEQKRREIEERFEAGQFPEWLTLEQLWDDKWLNATVTINQVITEIDEKVRRINENLLVINGLPEYSYEAEQLYKKSLDFGEAVRKAKEMAEIQRRKQALEAERQKGMPGIPQSEIKKPETDAAMKSGADMPVEQPKTPLNGAEQEKPKVYTFRFEVTLTAAQAAAMGAWCKDQGITLTRIQ
jgi:hypothetical protein